VVASEPERSSSESERFWRAGHVWLVSAALTLIAFGLVGCTADSSTLDSQLDTAIVERIVDGDTVDLQIGGRTERVRLIGVDAPESVARNVPVQCYGAEASSALAEFVPPGTVVEIRRDVEARDRYGRLLLYLYRAADGVFVNSWLIESGLAEAVSYEPNVAHEAMLTSARQQAERDLVGLWANCDGPDQPLH